MKIGAIARGVRESFTVSRYPDHSNCCNTAVGRRITNHSSRYALRSELFTNLGNSYVQVLGSALARAALARAALNAVCYIDAFSVFLECRHLDTVIFVSDKKTCCGEWRGWNSNTIFIGSLPPFCSPLPVPVTIKKNDRCGIRTHARRQRP